MSSASPHIGIVTWDFDPPIGGMGRHVCMLAKGLGADVFSRRDFPLPLGRNILFSLLIGPFLRRWIRHAKINLLHVQTGPGGVLLFRKPGRIPLVVTVHHTYAQQSRLPGQSWKKILIPWERRTLHLADHIVCVSPDTADTVTRFYRIDRDRITVISSCIDDKRFIDADKNLASRSRSCVFVGRRDSRKGFDMLCQAWVFVSKAVPDATLHVVGWNEIASESIVFHGCMSDADLASLIGSVRSAVCPSRLEGFGMAAAEAICSGTPVVATDVAGLRSVVRDGETGLLCALSSADLAAKLILILTDDPLWQRLHEGCQKHRYTFSIERSIALHRDIASRLY